MKCPFTVSPPSGTVLTNPIGAEGKIRKPSSITAVIYGNFTSSSNLISSSDWNAARISATRRSRMWRLLGSRSLLKSPLRKPAVVSVPAILLRCQHLILRSFIDLSPTWIVHHSLWSHSCPKNRTLVVWEDNEGSLCGHLSFVPYVCSSVSVRLQNTPAYILLDLLLL